MFVSKFSTEQWQGNRNKILVSPVRDWQEIEAAIKELDGKHQTLVTLTGRQNSLKSLLDKEYSDSW
jgi:hypothetical protein